MTAMAAHIDVVETIARFERELTAGCDSERLSFVMAILRRWQTDPDLTEASRQHATAVFERFAI